METLDKNKSGNPMEGEARGNMSIEDRGIPKERRTEGLAPFPYSRFC